MIFKTLKYIGVIFLLQFLMCSHNPIDVKGNKIPVEDKDFEKNYLRSMISDKADFYWGVSSSKLFIIDKDNPEVDFSIVKPCSAYNNNFFSPYGADFFYDNNAVVNMVNNWGIYKLYSIDSIKYVYQDWPDSPLGQLYSIDKNGKCWFIESRGNNFTINRIEGTFMFTLVSDSLTYDSIAKCDFLFSVDSTFSALLCDDKFNNTYLHLYDSDSLIEIDTTFKNVDEIEPHSLFWFDNNLYFLFESYDYSKFESKDTFYIQRGFYLVKRSVHEGWEKVNHSRFSSYTGSYSGFKPGSYVKTKFYSKSEIWVYNNRGYLSISSSSVKWTSFRDSYINNYNVHCFKNDTIVFFDEVAQDFIKIVE